MYCVSLTRDVLHVVELQDIRSITVLPGEAQICSLTGAMCYYLRG